ncbi:MAG: acetyl-coenzyme A synthetase N-terminal domain-containing protein, partial [Mycobacteriaceae bacterium]
MNALVAEPIWSPGPDVVDTRIMAFSREAGKAAGRDLSTYTELWRWSTTELEQFWSLVWSHFDVRSSTPYTEVLSGREIPGAQWFTGARLNYVEHVLRGDPASTAVIEADESGAQQATT